MASGVSGRFVYCFQTKLHFANVLYLKRGCLKHGFQAWLLEVGIQAGFKADSVVDSQVLVGCKVDLQ